MPIGTPAAPATSPAQTNASTAAGNGDGPNTPVEVKTRDYSITSRHKGTLEQVLSAIEDKVGAEDKVEVLVVHGKTHSSTPLKGIKQYGELNDMDGDY